MASTLLRPVRSRCSANSGRTLKVCSWVRLFVCIPRPQTDRQERRGGWVGESGHRGGARGRERGEGDEVGREARATHAWVRAGAGAGDEGLRMGVQMCVV